MLQNLIENRIEFISDCESWESAIKHGADKLLKEGYISQSYVDQMIANVHEFGPYIILADGVAMPHARPEAGALKTGMSFLKVENGISFPETDVPVRLFFTLASVDSNAHLEAMMELADLLVDDESVEKLLKVNTKEELLKIISK